jgi:manganese catalase
MHHHVKKLMYTVRVDTPDPKCGNMLLESINAKLGPASGASKAPAAKKDK